MVSGVCEIIVVVVCDHDRLLQYQRKAPFIQESKERDVLLFLNCKSQPCLFIGILTSCFGDTFGSIQDTKDNTHTGTSQQYKRNNIFNILIKIQIGTTHT